VGVLDDVQDAHDSDAVDAKDPLDGHMMAGSGSEQMAYLLRSEHRVRIFGVPVPLSPYFN
jgi:hypothetical protein